MSYNEKDLFAVEEMFMRQEQERLTRFKDAHPHAHAFYMEAMQKQKEVAMYLQQAALASLPEEARAAAREVEKRIVPAAVQWAQARIIYAQFCMSDPISSYRRPL